MNKVYKSVAALALAAGLCLSAPTAKAQWRGAFWGAGPWMGIGYGFGWGGLGYWPWWGYAGAMGYYPGYYQKPYTRRGYNDLGYPNPGFQLGAMPEGFYPFYVGANLYYYTGGAFYRGNDTGGYTVTDAPLGATVPALEKKAHSVIIDGAQYYEYRGVYYTMQTDSKGKTVYLVTGRDGVLNTPNGNIIVPKVGTTVSKLPEGSQKVTLKGIDYYVDTNGVYYQALIKDGNTLYRVVSVISQATEN